MTDPTTHDRIAKLVADNPVLLFMKGTPLVPAMRLFLARDRDARPPRYRICKRSTCCSDMEVRQGHQGIFRLADDPQLYVKGEFVGGSDIMMEMWEAGELHTLITDIPARAE